MNGPAVVIVNHNSGNDLRACLAAVATQTALPAEIVVVDNDSHDGSADNLGSVHVIRRANDGYGAAANAALAVTTGDPFVVLNPDVTLRPDWLALVAGAFADDARLGVTGGKLLFPDGATIQHAGGIVRPPLMLADHRHYRLRDDGIECEPVEVDYVTGAALAVRRQTALALGGFDEGFFLYFEETDLCARARAAGWRVHYLPAATAIHHESAVTGRESSGYYRAYHRGRLRYALKHLTAARFLVDLVPAERERLGSVAATDELLGLRHAYVESARSLASDDPLLAADRPELRPALADALAELAERAIVTTPTVPGHRADPLSLPGGTELRPLPFRSAVPGVAALRTAWNWMSTRWYLAPILAQQSTLNQSLADALLALDARLRAVEHRVELQAAMLAEIDRDLVTLARRAADRARRPADDDAGSAP